eukprot:scaffold1867_cov247-Pinguiococcus_pyrenoidosus.AAC.1
MAVNGTMLRTEDVRGPTTRRTAGKFLASGDPEASGVGPLWEVRARSGSPGSGPADCVPSPDLPSPDLPSPDRPFPRSRGFCGLRCPFSPRLSALQRAAQPVGRTGSGSRERGRRWAAHVGCESIGPCLAGHAGRPRPRRWLRQHADLWADGGLAHVGGPAAALRGVLLWTGLCAVPAPAHAGARRRLDVRRDARVEQPGRGLRAEGVLLGMLLEQRSRRRKDRRRVGSALRDLRQRTPAGGAGDAGAAPREKLPAGRRPDDRMSHHPIGVPRFLPLVRRRRKPAIPLRSVVHLSAQPVAAAGLHAHALGRGGHERLHLLAQRAPLRSRSDGGPAGAD